MTKIKTYTTSKKVWNCHEFTEKLLDKDFILSDDHLKSLREKCQVEVTSMKSKKNLTKDRNKAFKGTIYFVIHPTFHCPPFDLRSFGTCLYQNFFDIIDTHDSFGLIALLVQLCDMFWTLICSLVHFSPTIWLLNRVLRSPKFGLNFDWTLRQKRLERNEESLLEKGGWRLLLHY